MTLPDNYGVPSSWVPVTLFDYTDEQNASLEVLSKTPGVPNVYEHDVDEDYVKFMNVESMSNITHAVIAPDGSYVRAHYDDDGNRRYHDENGNDLTENEVKASPAGRLLWDDIHGDDDD